ncbi:MAG: VOC family protein [Deltaproteobacteria bacterium]|nr:VOC family protein [Deltaproteobacteria bacterium]
MVCPPSFPPRLFCPSPRYGTRVSLLQLLRATNEFEILTNNPGAQLKVAHLTAGPLMLQLIEYVAAGGATLDLHHNNVGSPHMCFYVPDVEAKYKEVQQRGDVKITSGLVQIAPTMRSFYTEDPDGVPVEFLQVTR